MRRRAYTEIEALLNGLLDRLESKPNVRRHVAYVDYDGFKSISEHDRLIRELGVVEKAGGIEIRRRPIDGAEAISFVLLKDAVLLYERLGRLPAAIRTADALAPLRSRTDLPATASGVFDQIEEAWGRGVASFGLRPSEVDALNEALDLALALNRRGSSSDSTLVDYRTFSRQAGVRSKALEQREPTVVTLFDHLFPDQVERGLDAAERMAIFGVARLPQPLLVSGPLALDGKVLADLPYWGIPIESADRLGLDGPVQYVLTIENYASFVRHVREFNGSRCGLILYTGGFPARPILRQIVRLAGLAQSTAFHWGDLDPGGIRIFRHLEVALARSEIILHPHQMTAEILRDHGIPFRPIRQLQLGAFADSALGDLWDAVATHHLIVEQETFRPADPRKPPDLGNVD